MGMRERVSKREAMEKDSEGQQNVAVIFVAQLRNIVASYFSAC